MSADRLPVMIRASNPHWSRRAMRYLKMEPRLRGIDEQNRTTFPEVTLSSVWGLLIVGGSWNGETTDPYPRLKAVAVTQSSAVSVGRHPTGSHEITVCLGHVTEAELIADQALALLLASFRDLLEVDATVRRGAWRPDGLANDLYRTTVGIAGAGTTARAVASRLAAFECDIVLIGRDRAGGVYPPETGVDVGMPRSNRTGDPALDAVVILPSARPADRRAAERLAKAPDAFVEVDCGEGSLAYPYADRRGTSHGRTTREAADDHLAARPHANTPGELPGTIMTGRRPAPTTVDLDIALRRSISCLAGLAAEHGSGGCSCLDPED